MGGLVLRGLLLHLVRLAHACLVPLLRVHQPVGIAILLFSDVRGRASHGVFVCFCNGVLVASLGFVILVVHGGA